MTHSLGRKKWAISSAENVICNLNFFMYSFKRVCTGTTSLVVIARSPLILVLSGVLYIFTNLAIGILWGRDEKPVSMSFLGFNDLCQYVDYAIGVGITIPAVYTAYHILYLLTRLVTSLIKTGANFLVLKDLWTQRKLISAITILFPFTLICTGIPEMKPNNLFFFPPLTPKSQSFL